MRITIIAALLILGTISLLAACNSKENLVSQVPGTQASATPQKPAAPPDNARRITAEELHPLWEKGKVLIVDTRNEPSFKQGHIKGSILIPSNEFEARADELPRDKMIVAYCT